MHLYGLRVAAAAAFAVLATTPASASADVKDTVDALRGHPADVLRSPLGDEVPGGGDAHVVNYPFENVARVRVDGHRAYVVSNTPLAVDGKPLDLGLERDGSMAAPPAAPIDLAIDLRSGAFTLQAPHEQSLQVERVRDDNTGDGSVVDGRAVIGGAGDDAGSVIQATSTGAESFEVVESAAQAERLRWHVALPTGWTMQPGPSGTIEVRDADGRVLYSVAAPWARAADGTGVPVELQQTGADSLSASITTAPDTAYPVVVDPDWHSTYDFAGSDGPAGWFLINEPVPGKPQLGYTTGFTPAGYAPGIWIWPNGSTIDQYVNVGGDGEEVRGGTRFEAPGTTRIKRVDFGSTTWELKQENCAAGTYRDVDQYLRFVLRDANANATTDDLQIGGTGGVATTNNRNPTTVPLLDPNQAAPTSTSASVTMWTEARTTASPKTIFPNPRPAGACSDPVSPFVNIGRVDITLVDNDDPTIAVSGDIRDWANSPETAWIGASGSHKPTGQVVVGDAGAGVQLRGPDEDAEHPAPLPVLSAQGPDGATVRYDLSGGNHCDTHHGTAAMEGRICPEAVTTDYTASSPLDLDELTGPSAPADHRDGAWTLRVDASDLVGHTATYGTWQYFVDTTPPTVDEVMIRDEHGDDVRDRWIRATATDEAAGGTLSVRATASDPANAYSHSLSGVRGIGMTWTQAGGATADLVPPNEEQCDAATIASHPIAKPCNDTQSTDVRTIPRHLAPGQYTADATARDFAGNGSASSRQASTWVDNTPPDVTFDGTLADLDGTWIAPSEPAELHVTASDPEPNASGVRGATVAIKSGDGREIEPPTALAACGAQPTGPGAAAPPAPLCPASTSGDVTVDTASWPDGRVEVSVDATDAVGNETARADADVVVHVDRQAPTVQMTGELAQLAGESGWTSVTGDLDTRVTAHDEGAGIQRIEIWAKDEQGTRPIESHTTCTPPAKTDGDEPPCPSDVSEAFHIDPSVVGDGTATFEARAVEYTGRIARVRKTLHLDDTPPPPVDDLKITRVLGSAVATWTPPEVPADSAPIVAYDVAYVQAGETNVIFNRVTSTATPLPMLPFAVAAKLYVCAVEATAARSACRTVDDQLAERASASASAPSWADTATKFAPDIRMDPYEKFFPISFSRVLDAGGIAFHHCDVCKGKSVPWVMENASDWRVSLDYPKSVVSPGDQAAWIGDREKDAGKTQKTDPSVYWSLSPEQDGFRDIYYWYYFAFNDYPLEPAIKNQLLELGKTLTSALDVPLPIAARAASARRSSIKAKIKQAKRDIRLLIATFDHEGDWEHVRIRVRSNNRSISLIGLSRHGTEAIIPSTDLHQKLRWSGARPQVWPADGSHAMQPACGVSTLPPSIQDAVGELQASGATVVEAVRELLGDQAAKIARKAVDKAVAYVKSRQVLQDEAQCPPAGQEPYHHKLSDWSVVRLDEGFRKQFGCFRGRLGAWPQIHGTKLGDPSPTGPLRQQPGNWAC